MRMTLLAMAVVFVPVSMSSYAEGLWDLARQNRSTLKIATLFTAHNVRDYLSSEKGLEDAIRWCKQTGVTHVFLESFRGNYTAERATLQKAKARFASAGFEVSGCVTTTRIGKISTGWKLISCYTDIPTQQKLQQIFEYTASIFDEIMIDDFLFTDCQCPQCKAARGDRSWAQYRCDLMTQLSRQRILRAAKAVNPNARIIIKYPQWYDDFHNRGYDVVRQSADFDRIWVGTETRDYHDKRWGGKVQYEAYYIMRWLGRIGGPKTGGGWFDPYGTHEDTYVEQARQTVLADAKEMLLFCYGSLLRETGPANVAKLRTEIPSLFKLAAIVRDKPIKGLLAPKPPDSDADGESYIFDFVGMLGLPLVPSPTIDTTAKAAFFSVHALKDPAFSEKLDRMLKAGTVVLITDGLAKRLPKLDRGRPNLLVLQVNRNPHTLLRLSRQQLRPIRQKLLAPFGLDFDAPNKVALYLIDDNYVAVENFNDEPIDARLRLPAPAQVRQVLLLPTDAKVQFSVSGRVLRIEALSRRSLVVFEYE